MSSADLGGFRALQVLSLSAIKLSMFLSRAHSKPYSISPKKPKRATVEVNGETAKEYDAAEDEASPPEDTSFYVPDPARPQLAAHPDPYVVKYIESVPGVNFQVRAQRQPGFQRHRPVLGFCVSLDG